MATPPDADQAREERDNFFRLTLLLFRLGNSKLRECLKAQWPNVHHNANGTLPSPWDDKASDATTLKTILKVKFQFKKQEKLFDSGNTNDWDFSLLSLVLLSKAYGAVLSAGETKALKEMKEIRNTLIGHAPDARISNTSSKTEWSKACKALENFNATQEEFDAIEEDIKKPVDILYPILKECCKMDDEILKAVNDSEKNAKERHDEVMGELSKITVKVESLSTKRNTDEPKASKIMRLQMKDEHQQVLQNYLPAFEKDIIATELFDNLPCLTDEQKNDVAYDEKNYLSSRAVKKLVEKLKEHEKGFHEFMSALRKAGHGGVALLLDGNPGNEEDEKGKEDDEGSNYEFYYEAKIAADILVPMQILRSVDDGEQKEKNRQLHLETRIGTLFENIRSTALKELKTVFEQELPKGVFFIRIKRSDNRRIGVHLTFRVAKVEHLEEIWTFYQEKKLEMLLKDHLLPKAKEEGQDEEDLDLKVVFEKKDYEAIKRIFNEENKTLEEPGTSAAADVDEAMEIEPKKVSLPGNFTRIPRRKVYLDGDDYNLSRELNLRKYQEELAAPALEGKNTIICAPTNSGKTFVAMEIAKRHLDAFKDDKEENKGKQPKVVFIVDKQNLVLQQKGRFEEYLTNYNTSDITGTGSENQYLPLEILLQQNDIVVLTAQILVNAIKEKKVSITDVTLLVFDECHHANKDHPYNKIMQTYLDLKINISIEPNKLPQVIGLTASLGVGQSSKEEKAKEHVLRMCANLDASNIRTVSENVEELEKVTGCNMPKCKSVQVNRKPDIFEQEINKNMEEIETFIKVSPPTTNREVESYRQWIEELETKANEMENNDYFICAQRLKYYHEALLINSNVRIEDAIFRLDEYFNSLDESKFTQTETWLQESFLKAKERIYKQIQEAGRPENPLLKELQDQIKGFHAKAPEEGQAIGILFTRTRDFANALKKWMEETAELKEILRPDVLLGSAELTQSQQEQVIKNFKEGKVNIIIATTVAEEGLDIPQCNYVIRYGVKGNEISYVQSRGRIRAEEGNFIHLSDAKSRGAEHEQRNQYREMLMTLAVEDAQNMKKEDFMKKVKSFQTISVRAVKNKQKLEEKKKSQLKYVVDQSVTFYCKKCNALVCNAQDIRRFKEAHHVVINKEIYERIDIKRHEKPETYDDILFNKKIHCKKCDLDWGVIITVEGTEWPCLKVASFVTTLNHGKVRKLFKKWKGLPFKICDITLEEMIQAEYDDN